MDSRHPDGSGGTGPRGFQRAGGLDARRALGELRRPGGVDPMVRWRRAARRSLGDPSGTLPGPCRGAREGLRSCARARHIVRSRGCSPHRCTQPSRFGCHRARPLRRGLGRGATRRRTTSHWTLGGAPLPYVPFDETWEQDDEVPAYVGLYEASRRRSPRRMEVAGIPVERIDQVMLVAGGDDQVWPALSMSESIKARRAAHGLDTMSCPIPKPATARSCPANQS